MTTLDTTQPIHDQIDNLRKAADANVPPDVRDYYDGNQPPVATIEQMQSLGDRATRPYIENLLKRCVDTLAGRLLFRQYLCEDGPREQEWLEGFAVRNKINAHVVANTVRILVDGNNAISLSWEADTRDGGRPVVHQEPWWDGDEGMYVEVDDTGLELWAVKEWTDLDKRKRRTVYLPDQIQRFVQTGGSWQPFVNDEDQHIAQWTKRDGNPLGVPVIHFGNTINADTVYGASTIEPLLGLQDALNGTIFDIIAAQAINAFGIFTATGVEVSAELAVGPGRLWKTASPDAKFGVLNGASMSPILDGYKAIRAAIANQFPVSEHSITGGQWPSGMAFQRADLPTTTHVKLLGETVASSIVRLAHRAMEMTNAFSGASLDEGHMILAEWEPAEQLDEGAVIEIQRERVGLFADLAKLPKALMIKTGLVDEDEVASIVAEVEAQRDAFLTDLNAGSFDQDYDATESLF